MPALLGPETIGCEFQAGFLFFQLRKASERGRYVWHVGMFDESGVYADNSPLLVLDWPVESDGDWVQHEVGGHATRCAVLVTADLAIGWFAELFSDRAYVYRIACDEARKILGRTIQMSTGSVPDILYTPHPSRATDFKYEGDPNRAFPFRGSCCGFVEHCFETAQFDVVDEKKLPELCLEDAAIAIAMFYDRERPPRVHHVPGLLERKGISPPYTFLQPGYHLVACRSKEPLPVRIDSFDSAFT
ncbi:MAG: hypothetical protein AB1601_09360 [Planctomycetota bacterium]